MLTYFTATSSLPRVDGSSEGMALVLTQALHAARAADAPIAAASAALAQNCLPQTAGIHQPVGGAALLDLLV